MTKPSWMRPRLIWILLLPAAALGFASWRAIGLRPTVEARAAARSDSLVVVRDLGKRLDLRPAQDREDRPGLLLLYDDVVKPESYALLARELAAAGYPVTLFSVPSWSIVPRNMLLSDPDEVLHEIHVPWVVAGLGEGADLAVRLVQYEPTLVYGLVLMATAEPQEITLAGLSCYVARVYGTADGVVPVEQALANTARLPPSTRTVELEGGNHAQFGEYAFHPGDGRATLPRAEQRRRIVAALRDALEAAAGPNAPDCGARRP